MKIVAIGAHPDDIELGCGGLLLKAVRNGHNVYMYTLTRGSASGDPEERTKELIQSSKIIAREPMVCGSIILNIPIYRIFTEYHGI